MTRRPSMFSAGAALPVGTYHVTQTDWETYSVCRTVGALRWYPLTARENPAWLTWPSFAAAAKWIDDKGEDLCAYPFWGR